MIAVPGRWLALAASCAVGCADGGGPGGGVTSYDLGDGGRRTSADSGQLIEPRIDAGVVPADTVAPSREASPEVPAVSPRDAGAKAQGLPGDASNEGTPVPSGDAGDAAPDESLVRIPGWSVRKRVRSPNGKDVVLEEVPSGFGDEVAGRARLRMLWRGRTTGSWTAPNGSVLSDFCLHPSGAISAILLAPNLSVSIERLSPEMVPLSELAMHDSKIASDPHVTDAGALDLLANALARDAARIASVGEDVVAAVSTSWNSIVTYRTAFSGGAWDEPRRALAEPPAGLTPYLPIGGSFDTFGAMFVWFRPLLDVDEAGNAYVATWANSSRIRAHVSEFQDGLTPLPTDPSTPGTHDSDVLVTKMDRAGTRVWSRVIGTMHEDEPYAIRAHAGAVAIAGRARRFPGFDNTTWDAFVSVVSSNGEVLGSRAFPLDASGIFLAIDSLPGGGWVLGGSDGWSQNPDGLSVLTFGTKLLGVLPAMEAPLLRVPLPPGPRHNEIRTVVADSDQAWFGGHEDGPIMHTGDSDPSQIFATGVLGVVRPIPGR